MEYTYHAKIEADPDGGFIVTFPDVPEAITAGDDMGEALTNASQALGLALRKYYDVGDPLPKAAYQHGKPVSLDAWNSLKLLVIETVEQSGITKVELAKRLGRSETEARRILNWNYPSKMQIMEQALAVLGKRIVISIRDAA